MKVLEVPWILIQNRPEIVQQVVAAAVYIQDNALYDAAIMPIEYENLDNRQYYIPLDYRIASWLLVAIPDLRVVDIKMSPI